MSLEGYNAARSAEMILEGLLVGDQIRQQIREFLIYNVDAVWLLVDISDIVEHLHENGYVQWTASRFCSKCLLIHTVIIDVVNDGEFTVAKTQGCK